LAGNQDNVSEWSDMSTRGLLFYSANTKKKGLVQYKTDIIISSNATCFRDYITENYNKSLTLL